MSAGLRRAREEDIPQIEALITAEGLPAYGLAEYLETFFVLDEGERAVGCAGLEIYGEAALLRSVVVAPERRGRVDGRRLVEAALAEARERSVRRVYLFTMHADGFFRRLGFREVGLDGFEEAVRASRQYEAVSQIPQLRERVKGMALDLGR
ncbi:MAG: GNAT family N-acetyltransferase [Chloroflexi bacterium]|nr:GNAT family N-acetyltransferase [Chloroflexota bacterium]